MKNVLYVSQCNLFSVRLIEENGMAVRFANDKATMMKDGRVIATGRRVGQLHRLDIELSDVSDSADGSSCETGLIATKKHLVHLLHRRFGHLGTASMKILWNHAMRETTTKVFN